MFCEPDVYLINKAAIGFGKSKNTILGNSSFCKMNNNFYHAMQQQGLK